MDKKSTPSLQTKKETSKAFQNTILSWFEKNGRDLPWRKTRNPYHIWVSEVMLQQTQVDRVVDYYQRFLQRYPALNDLANSTWDEMLEYWRGLGFYRRGRNMLKTAQAIVAEHAGHFPQDVETLETLPGIGPYTSRAIAVFAYEQDKLVLDTNTSRIFSRYFGIEGENLLKTLAEEAHWLVPKGKAWAFHQSLMDFGSSICGAKTPLCSECPLQKKCVFAQQAPTQKENTLPKKKLKKEVSSDRVEVAVGIIHKQGKILITKRQSGKHLAGLWEFPGGKREGKEDWRTCLKREIFEELGIEVAVRPHDWLVDYDYGDQLVHLRFHRCSILKGEATGKENQKLKWVSPQDLLQHNFPAANEQIIHELATARYVDPTV